MLDGHKEKLKLTKLLLDASLKADFKKTLGVKLTFLSSHLRTRARSCQQNLREDGRTDGPAGLTGPLYAPPDPGRAAPLTRRVDSETAA